MQFLEKLPKWDKLSRWLPWPRRQESPTPDRMRAVRDDINQAFDRFFEHSWGLSPTAWGWSPPFELREHDKEYVLQAEVPGLRPDEVYVGVADDALTVRGERREARDAKGPEYYWSERRYRAFSRRLPLPPGVDPAKVSAELQHGLLSVHLPKSPQYMPHRIPVRTV